MEVEKAGKVSPEKVLTQTLLPVEETTSPDALTGFRAPSRDDEELDAEAVFCQGSTRFPVPSRKKMTISDYRTSDACAAVPWGGRFVMDNQGGDTRVMGKSEAIHLRCGDTRPDRGVSPQVASRACSPYGG